MMTQPSGPSSHSTIITPDSPTSAPAATTARFPFARGAAPVAADELEAEAAVLAAEVEAEEEEEAELWAEEEVALPVSAGPEDAEDDG